MRSTSPTPPLAYANNLAADLTTFDLLQSLLPGNKTMILVRGRPTLDAASKFHQNNQMSNDTWCLKYPGILLKRLSDVKDLVFKRY